MLPCQRDKFEIPRDVAYLNAAYMTPLLRDAVRAGEEGVRRKAQPWRVTSRDFFTESERARALFACLIEASPEDVAIIPSASYGLAVAARNLKVQRGQRIILLADQFPSNVYCWQSTAIEAGAEIVAVEAREDGDLTAAILAAIDRRTAIVALSHCRWTDGRRIDLVRVGQRVRDVGAALVIDATQSLGALPFDVRTIQPDYLVAAAYKWLLGPYSLGWLYAAPHRQDGRPIEENWITRGGSEDFSRLVDYAAGYQPGARRFDVGERSNFALMPIAVAALEQLLAWSVEEIAGTLLTMTQGMARRAAELGLEAVPMHLRAGHYLALRFPKGAPRGLPERLASENVFVSLRGDWLRVTPHLYNDDEDVDRLFKAIEPFI